MSGWVENIARLGRAGLVSLQAMGRAGMVLYNAVVGPSPQGSLWPLLVKQIYAVGVLSLIIIIVSGFFIGMVLGLQGYHTLARFGSEQAVGQLVALSLVRELGPVVTGLLFAGCAGSSLTAEIGLMKITEQLSSMEMIGVDPLKRIIAPRFWAGVISMPLLTSIFCMVGVMGSVVVGVEWLGIDKGSFWVSMHQAVDFQEDVMRGMLKSLVFGVVVTWIAVFQGYDTVPTSEGLGWATTRTVVYASLAVLGLDFILTAVMFGDF